MSPDDRGEESGPDWISPLQALARRPLPESAEAAEPAAEARDLRYGYRVGELGLLVPAGSSGEALGAPAIYPVPHTASWFLGLINLRGNLVPVFELGQILHQEAGPPAGQPTVLVLGKGQQAVGLRVDGLPRALHLGEPLAPLPALPDDLQAYLSGAFADTDGGVWLELDMDGLLRALRGRIPA